MIWIIIIKIFLTVLSVITVGLLPLLALVNWWIWNNVIVGITGFSSITSFWVILGLTTVGSSIPMLPTFKLWESVKKKIKDE